MPVDWGGSSKESSTVKWAGSSTPTARKPTKPLVEIIKIARRFSQIENPADRTRALQELGKALQGVPRQKLSRIAQEAELGADSTQFVLAAGTGGPGGPFFSALKFLDRPAQAVKGAVVETAGDPLGALKGDAARGAWRGLTGKETYTGTQALLGTAGVNKQASRQIRENLPGPVRVAGDFGGDVIFDPTNYLTLGTTALADDAARTVAKRLAGQAAESAGLNATAQGIFSRLKARGLKALSPDELTELRSAYGGRIPAAIRHKVNRSTGGVRIAGVQVPGTRNLLSRAGVKPNHKFLAGTEQILRPRASLRQAVRTGEIPYSTVQDVENITAQVRGAQFMGSLASRRATRGAQAALGEVLGKKASSRAAIRAGRQALEREPELLDRVRDAMDVGGGRAAIDALPPKERAVANFLDTLRNEDYQALVQAGRLQNDIGLPQNQYLMHIRSGREPAPSVKSTGVPDRGQAFLEKRTEQAPVRELGESYIQDPIVMIGTHAKGTAREVGAVNAWNDLARLGTEDQPLAILDTVQQANIKSNPQWRELYDEMEIPVTRESGRTSNETVLVSNHVAPFFRKVIKSQTDNVLKRNIEWLNALWARWATGTTGFVSRNVLQGNLYMGMVLAEARDVRVWARSLGMMKRLQSGMSRLGDPYALLKPEEAQLIQGAMNNNAVESGFLDFVTQQADEAIQGGPIVSRVKGASYSPLSPNFLPIERISAANRWMENWSRLSVYANKIKQGYDPPEAAAIARRYLLDYKDLSRANEALRMVNPFLTWTYKSAPLILGTLAKDPRKVKIPLALLNAIGAEGESTENVNIMPKWMSESGAVVIPKAIRKGLPALGPVDFTTQPQAFVPSSPIHSTLETIKPIQSLIEVLQRRPGSSQELAGDIFNLIGPGGVIGGGAKSIVEAAAGRQFFSGREFDKGERVPTPAGFQRIFGETMPWEQYNALQNLLPGASRVATLSPQSPYEKEAQGRRVASQIGGFGVYPVGKSQSRNELFRRLSILRALLKDLESRGRPVPPTPTTPSGVKWGG